MPDEWVLPTPGFDYDAYRHRRQQYRLRYLQYKRRLSQYRKLKKEDPQRIRREKIQEPSPPPGEPIGDVGRIDVGAIQDMVADLDTALGRRLSSSRYAWLLDRVVDKIDLSATLSIDEVSQMRGRRFVVDWSVERRVNSKVYNMDVADYYIKLSFVCPQIVPHAKTLLEFPGGTRLSVASNRLSKRTGDVSKWLRYSRRSDHLNGRGFEICEANVDFCIRTLIDHSLRPCEWWEIDTEKASRRPLPASSLRRSSSSIVRDPTQLKTLADAEVFVSIRDVRALDAKCQRPDRIDRHLASVIPDMTFLTYDIEVETAERFPTPKRDRCIQITCHLMCAQTLDEIEMAEKSRRRIRDENRARREGRLDQLSASERVTAADRRNVQLYKRVLLTVGSIDTTQLPHGTVAIQCVDEKTLLLRFAQLWAAANPDMVSQYNGNSFDEWYILERSKILGVAEIQHRGRRPWKPVYHRKETCKRTGVSKDVVKITGTCNIDIMFFVRTYTYTKIVNLNAVSMKYLKQTKLDLMYSLIAKYQKTKEGRTVLAVYCDKDGELNAKLWYKLNIVPFLIMLSRVTSMPPQHALDRGKEFMINSYWMYTCKRFPIPTRHRCFDSATDDPHRTSISHSTFDRYEFVTPTRKSWYEPPKGKYRGAVVLQPVTGIFQGVYCLDFAGLYPSVIIWRNLDYTTIMEPHMIRHFIDHLGLIEGEDYWVRPDHILLDEGALDRDRSKLSPAVQRALADNDRRRERYVRELAEKEPLEQQALQAYESRKQAECQRLEAILRAGRPPTDPSVDAVGTYGPDWEDAVGRLYGTPSSASEELPAESSPTPTVTIGEYDEIYRRVKPVGAERLDRKSIAKYVDSLPAISRLRDAYERIRLAVRRSKYYIRECDGRLRGLTDLPVDNPRNPGFITKDVRKGVLVIMEEELRADRKQAKREMGRYADLVTELRLKKADVSDLDEEDQKLLAKYSELFDLKNTLQQVLKLIGNSIYGFTGSPTSNHADRRIAEAITLTSRNLIETTRYYGKVMIRKDEGWSHDAEKIYGDTDSVFFWMRHTDLFELSGKIRDWFNLRHRLRDYQRLPDVGGARKSKEKPEATGDDADRSADLRAKEDPTVIDLVRYYAPEGEFTPRLEQRLRDILNRYVEEMADRSVQVREYVKCVDRKNQGLDTRYTLTSREAKEAVRDKYLIRSREKGGLWPLPRRDDEVRLSDIAANWYKIDRSTIHQIVVGFVTLKTVVSVEDEIRRLCKDVNSIYTMPVEQEYEKIYSVYSITGKKGYGGEMYEAGHTIPYLGIKGYSSVRRDGFKMKRDACRSILDAVVKNNNPMKAVQKAQEYVRRLYEREYSMDELICSATIKEFSEYKTESKIDPRTGKSRPITTPTHVRFAMNEVAAGRMPSWQAGTRVHWIITGSKGRGITETKLGDRAVGPLRAMHEGIPADVNYYLEKLMDQNLRLLRASLDTRTVDERIAFADRLTRLEEKDPKLLEQLLRENNRRCDKIVLKYFSHVPGANILGATLSTTDDAAAADDDSKKHRVIQPRLRSDHALFHFVQAVGHRNCQIPACNNVIDRSVVPPVCYQHRNDAHSDALRRARHLGRTQTRFREAMQSCYECVCKTVTIQKWTKPVTDRVKTEIASCQQKGCEVLWKRLGTRQSMQDALNDIEDLVSNDVKDRVLGRNLDRMGGRIAQASLVSEHGRDMETIETNSRTWRHRDFEGNADDLERLYDDYLGQWIGVDDEDLSSLDHDYQQYRAELARVDGDDDDDELPPTFREFLQLDRKRFEKMQRSRKRITPITIVDRLLAELHIDGENRDVDLDDYADEIERIRQKKIRAQNPDLVISAPPKSSSSSSSSSRRQPIVVQMEDEEPSAPEDDNNDNPWRSMLNYQAPPPRRRRRRPRVRRPGKNPAPASKSSTSKISSFFQASSSTP